MAARADIFRLRVQGAGRRGVLNFSRSQRQLQDALNTEFREAQRFIGSGRFHSVLADIVPQDTGAMLENIRGVFFTRSDAVRVTVTTAPRADAGYNYIPVTRFGHRKREIKPKNRVGPRGGRAMLGVRFEGHRADVAGNVTPMPSVKGVRRSVDWVVEAEPFFDRIGAAIERRLVRNYDYSRLITGRVLR